MERYKYPRTYHFSFSEGVASDDKIVENDNMLEGKIVVVTIKMDGENTTIYPDGMFHARSLDSRHREYHSWLLSKIPCFCYNIPSGCRVCGEYLYARHSIAYTDLEDYFLAFSIWNAGNDCLSWADTIDLCKEIGLFTVPELYVGPFDLDLIKRLAKETVQQGHEGIIVRNADSFNIADFSSNIAKYVRANHVQTDTHWTQQRIVANELRRDYETN